MSYTAPTDPLNVTWVGAPQYSPARSTLPATWASNPRYVAPESAKAPTPVPAPTIKLAQLFISPTGFSSSTVQSAFEVRFADLYGRPQGVINASWFGALPYSAPSGNITGIWAQARFVSAQGFRSESLATQVPAPVLFWQQFISPSGWQSSVVDPTAFALYPWQYPGPEWVLNASWFNAESYTPPVGSISAAWQIPIESEFLSAFGIAPTLAFGTAEIRYNTRFLNASSWASSVFGSHTVIPSRFLYVFGHNSQQFGNPLVSFYSRFLYLTGFLSDSFGQTTVELDPFKRYVYPNGWRSSLFGQPTIYLYSQYLLAIGATHTEFGTPFIDYLLPQVVEVTGRSSLVIPTTHFISNYLRFVNVINRGIDATRIGSHRIDFRVRTIVVPWEVYTQWGTPTVGRDVTISADYPWMSSQFGIPNVDYANVYEMQGWDSLQMSDINNPGHRVSYYTQYILADQMPYTFLEWGNNRIYNLRQYIQQLFWTGYDEYYNRGVGINNWVYLRNRTITTEGTRFDRVSYLLTISLAARAIRPSGFRSSTVERAFLVSHGIRQYFLTGWDSALVSKFNMQVYNAARAIYPSGIAPTFVVPRVPSVISNLQTIKTHTGATTEWGTPFIADAIRTIDLATQGRDWLRFPYPTWDSLGVVVRFRSRSIFPPSVDGRGYYYGPPGVGSPSVLGPFRKIITPRWTWRPNAFGEAAVRNKIPQAFVRGWVSHTAYPDAANGNPHKVEFLNRVISVPGYFQELFGRTSIKDRRQFIVVNGYLLFVLPDTHQIRLANPYLPSTQIIIHRDGYPYPNMYLDFRLREFRPKEGGIPTVQSSPFPEGWDSMRFGNPDARTQGAKTFWYWPSSEFGTPTLNPPQIIEVDSSEDLYTRYGSPYHFGGSLRLTPYTIYCTDQYPPLTSQLTFNHDGTVGTQPWRPLRRGDGTGPRASYGTPAVSTSPQYARQNHSPISNVDPSSVVSNNARLALWIQYAYPNGVNSLKMGYPLLDPRPQEIYVPPWPAVFGNSTVYRSLSVFGRPTVALDFTSIGDDQYASPAGLNSQSFGTTFIENFHRNLYVSGVFGIRTALTPWASENGAATQWGNNTPMVHFPRRVYPNGYIATQSGTARLSYNPQYAVPNGIDSFESEASITSVRDGTLRIYHKTNPLLVSGYDASNIGSHSIRLGQQRIYPYQIQGSRCLGHDVRVTFGA